MKMFKKLVFLPMLVLVMTCGVFLAACTDDGNYGDPPAWWGQEVPTWWDTQNNRPHWTGHTAPGWWGVNPPTWWNVENNHPTWQGQSVPTWWNETTNQPIWHGHTQPDWWGVTPPDWWVEGENPPWEAVTPPTWWNTTNNTPLWQGQEVPTWWNEATNQPLWQGVTAPLWWDEATNKPMWDGITVPLWWDIENGITVWDGVSIPTWWNTTNNTPLWQGQTPPAWWNEVTNKPMWDGVTVPEWWNEENGVTAWDGISIPEWWDVENNKIKDAPDWWGQNPPNNTDTLASPTNVKINEENWRVTWNNVPNASGYIVRFYSPHNPVMALWTATPSINFPNNFTWGTPYSITVQAIGGTQFNDTIFLSSGESAPIYNAQYVEHMIWQLPSGSGSGVVTEGGLLTLAHNNLVQDVRTAYNSLAENQKSLVSNLWRLKEVEARIIVLQNNPAVNNVVVLFNAIPQNWLITLADEGKIEDAREAFVALPEHQKVLVVPSGEDDPINPSEMPWILQSAIQRIQELKSNPDLNKVAVVNALIHNLPNPAITGGIDGIILTPDNINAIKAAVEEAREAFDALDEHLKPLVGNVGKLEQLERMIEDFSVVMVIQILEHLPGVDELTLAHAGQVEAARIAFNALTDDQRQQIWQENWELAWRLIESDRLIGIFQNPVTKNVYDLIMALPSPQEVTLAHENQIEEAREAWEALTAAQRKLFGEGEEGTNEGGKELWILIQAERALLLLHNPHVQDVIDMIKALPNPWSSDYNVTIDHKEQILAAWEAYNELDENLKVLVAWQNNDGNHFEASWYLRVIMGSLAEIVANDSDRQAAQVVIDMINNNIYRGVDNPITLADAPMIESIRAAFEELENWIQKSLVNNLSQLEWAESWLKWLANNALPEIPTGTWEYVSYDGKITHLVITKIDNIFVFTVIVDDVVVGTVPSGILFEWEGGHILLNMIVEQEGIALMPMLQVLGYNPVDFAPIEFGGNGSESRLRFVDGEFVLAITTPTGTSTHGFKLVDDTVVTP
jgi:hypothetical protein